jgi:hypothetical protein
LQVAHQQLAHQQPGEGALRSLGSVRRYLRSGWPAGFEPVTPRTTKWMDPRAKMP